MPKYKNIFWYFNNNVCASISHNALQTHKAACIKTEFTELRHASLRFSKRLIWITSSSYHGQPKLSFSLCFALSTQPLQQAKRNETESIGLCRPAQAVVYSGTLPGKV